MANNAAVERNRCDFCELILSVSSWSNDNAKETETNENGDQVVKKQIEVWLEDINVFMYWINDS